MTSRLAPRNPLTVPEIAGTTTRDGLTVCAVRMPGEREWQGVGSLGIMPIRTLEAYADPRDAIDAIRTALERDRLDW